MIQSPPTHWIAECVCCQRDMRRPTLDELTSACLQDFWVRGRYNTRVEWICNWCVLEAQTGQHVVRVGNWREDAGI
jgi:hypothetical protein